MNLNDLAKEITLDEGKLKSVSIAQVKEIMRLVFREMAEMNAVELGEILRKYRE